MEASRTEYCTVRDQRDQPELLCYSRAEHGLSNICLTDAADVWSTEHTEDTLNQFRQRFAVASTEDFIVKLRAACGRGQASVVAHGPSAVVRVRSGSGEQSVALCRLDGPRAAQELKEQLFSMAARLTRPDRKRSAHTLHHSPPCYGSPSASPVKGHRAPPAEFKPQQQQQNWTPSKAMKKRLPGASLINPGAKRSNVSRTNVPYHITKAPALVVHVLDISEGSCRRRASPLTKRMKRTKRMKTDPPDDVQT
uniref:protein PAXX isoform X1 n=1 Tax=Gasterosteus aculeatus aculeatus TaxID=481459 RepID=UPI001A989E89|nr:protein PAXX isoform X1 [Gasterosteus aculeatus aculeatus]